MTQTTQLTQNKKDTTKYLIYAAIALLVINFILIFLPFVEVYQPSKSKTVFGVTTYEGWHTSYGPMAMFIIPIFFTGIPYLCSITSVLISLIKKNSKSGFFKIKNDAVTKPIKFFWLKFAAIANVIAMFYVYISMQSEVGYLEEYGAYCHITFFGVLNVLSTVAFIVLLFAFSRKTKAMFTLVNKAQISTVGNQETNENKTKENEQ